MRELLRHPMFAIGLALRLALIAAFLPTAVDTWYAPFLESSLATPTIDPWSRWIANGGTPASFPYGYAMWLAFVPATLAAKLAGIPTYYAYAATLLAVDVGLLSTLHALIPRRKRLLLVTYWLSPIVLLATYAIGLNDLVPALLLALAILGVRRVAQGAGSRALIAAGAWLAAAISAKLSMIVAAPLFGIYLWNHRPLRRRAPMFVAGFAAAALLLGLPFLASDAGVRMIASNPEIGKIYRLAIDLGGRSIVYIVPLLYAVTLYLAWRIRRLNFELFVATTGMSFLTIVLLTPASPGWFVWTLPFLVFYQAASDRIAAMLVAAFSGLFLLNTLLVTPLRTARGTEFDLGAMLHLTERAGDHTASLLYTAMVAVGAILALRIWREAIRRNHYFRLSRSPFVIGVAGDSGAGKDTFVDAVAGLFGAHSVARLSGDDYHLWDRHKPMWQVMTHLNPMANDLEAFGNDIVALTDGRPIQSRHYDHSTGKMGRPQPIPSNDIIIASGLHALYLPILRECYDLKVYLDIDEDLRRYFKIRRDTVERQHAIERVLEAFERRAPDAERFIRPQAAYADLVLSLRPIHTRALDPQDGTTPLRLKLVARTRHGFNERSLSRVLVGVCGLHVDMASSEDGAEIQTTIEGEASATDIAFAAEMLCPQLMEFLDMPPQWRDGMTGLMQLITLTHINQALTKRFI